MIEEINGEYLNVCVCNALKRPFPYIAHCLQLDLIGEGRKKQEAVSRLKQVIEIQCRICEERRTSISYRVMVNLWIVSCLGAVLLTLRKSSSWLGTSLVLLVLLLRTVADYWTGWEFYFPK